jgi:hypothetical protein
MLNELGKVALRCALASAIVTIAGLAAQAAIKKMEQHVAEHSTWTTVAENIRNMHTDGESREVYDVE